MIFGRTMERTSQIFPRSPQLCVVLKFLRIGRTQTSVLCCCVANLPSVKLGTAVGSDLQTPDRCVFKVRTVQFVHAVYDYGCRLNDELHYITLH